MNNEGQRWKAQQERRGASAEVVRRPESRVRLSAFCFFMGGTPASGTLELLGGGAFGGERTPDVIFLGPFLGDSAGRGMPESSYTFRFTVVFI